ncbi:MAG: hypothetical protein QG595_849 [Pseudomonadota bacterium]|nr:hypothetical protein [Pseudomonadota bacterium]
MISTRQTGSLLIAAAVACTVTPAFAADDRISAQSGFYGNVLFGGGYIDLESNLVSGNQLIDVKDSSIQSVNQSPDSNDDAFPIISGEVNYAFGNRWEAFFGGSLEDYVTLDFNTRLGIRKQWDQVGIMGVSLLFSGLPAEVWEDPYLVGTPRSDTDRDSSGLRLDWWRILDSNFYLQLVTREIDIDNEASGTDPALGLTPDEILLLRRDGDDRRIRLGYRWTDGPHTLQPEITIGEDDRDGGAVAADTTAVQLTYSYGANEWRWVSTAQYFNTDYDAANPVYDRRTDSDGYALSVAAFRKLHIGDNNWNAFGSMTYADSDSDVDFHDATAFGVTVGVAYFFGNP